MAKKNKKIWKQHLNTSLDPINSWNHLFWINFSCQSIKESLKLNVPFSLTRAWNRIFDQKSKKILSNNT